MSNTRKAAIGWVIGFFIAGIANFDSAAADGPFFLLRNVGVYLFFSTLMAAIAVAVLGK